MKNNDVIRVMIVDDHKIIRDGLKAMLASDPEILIVAEAQNGQEAISWVNDTEVDVILMDISMPGMDGISVTHHIISRFPKIKIFALTMHQDISNITRMMKAGAKGYVMKTAEKEDLLKGVHSLMEGNTYFSEEVSQVMLSKYMSHPMQQNDVAAAEVNLTDREVEILNLIAQEKTNVEIGEMLFLSPRTVDTHRRNLMGKLKVKNAVGLIKYAFHMGLVLD